ncbi:hypothetical protein Bca4012_082781 [Brassica carinata]
MKNTVKRKRSFWLLIPLRDTEDAAETASLHISNLVEALEWELKHIRSTKLLEAGDLKAKESFTLSARNVDVEGCPQDPERGGALCKPWKLTARIDRLDEPTEQRRGRQRCVKASGGTRIKI